MATQNYLVIYVRISSEGVDRNSRPSRQESHHTESGFFERFDVGTRHIAVYFALDSTRKYKK
jgi:hypothetical protein